jgi:ribosomal protein L37AE/L43A
MSQHFLLSAAAKTLTLGSVVWMSDSEVETTFIRLRWSDNKHEPYCPKCGGTIVYPSRRKGSLRWQCKACQRHNTGAVDVKQVGRELGVRYVLEGGLRKSGNRIRVTA